MTVWAQGLAAFALILIAVLAVPLELRGRADSSANDKWSIRAQWLLGLVHIERTSSQRKGQRPSRQEGPATRRTRGRGMRSFAGSASFFRRAWRLMRALLRRTHVRRLDVQLTVGLEDPADTGCLMSALQPVCLWVRPHLPGRISVMPDFDGSALELQAEAEVRLVPLRWVGPLFAFGAWAALHAWKTRRRRR